MKNSKINIVQTYKKTWKTKFHYYLFYPLIVCLIVSCGGGSSDSATNDNADNTSTNTAPTANTGVDQTGETGETFLLDGSASTDADNDNLTYAWSITSQPSDSTASLINSNSVSPTLLADTTGNYVVSLIVNDGAIDSTADTVTITATALINNSAPVANAGNDQNVSTSTRVNLSGSDSSDTEGDSLTYLWSLTSFPNGSSSSLSSTTSIAANFTPDIDGEYVVSLIVNDGSLNSALDSVTITAVTGNSAPVANAGDNQSVKTATQVNLNGSNSTDANNDSLSYSWSFSSIPNSSTTSLNNAKTQTPDFTPDIVGSYVVALVVNDGSVDSTANTVIITVTEPIANTAPTAVAGDNMHINTDNSITLNGSDSSDSDGDTITYSWTISSAPAGSTATLSNATAESPDFTPDIDGNYAISLVVNDGSDDSDTDTVLITAAGWLINNSIMSANISATLVNVQSVSSTVLSNIDMIEMRSTGIPDYQITMTLDNITELNNRPNAATDFKTGSTSASVGDVIDFGESIGYLIGRVGCALEYWPTGPQCPSDQSNVEYIPTTPQVASETCNVSTNTMGYMLNGTAIFNWGDGASYNNERVWSNIAPKFEFYDVDICLGHAQQEGVYHHHMSSQCLMDLFDDDGTGHSPLFGYGADGYPIYGPYHASGVLAKPAWVQRDYDDTNSVSGCGTSGERNCQLIDQYDVSKGTTSVTSGPSTSDTVTSMSGNNFITTSGHYFEDYYYDENLTALGGEYLDQHNGHTHDNYGYHYHTTVTDESGTLTAAFPYNFGPTFYGELPSNGITSCK